ncbi:chemotaxis protein [Paenibacillus elgii]|uniref:Chemotaxis protein n=1 Tax=Paenibacillus elgii TaxID=189691 RepID=A0A163TUF9_9BACL|nr:MFS transporter [Paenibacillus elgii]KZE72387.1 chemotaxis protein [Paenibacillus elgii]
MNNKWVVYLLALSVFLIGTIEYIISGILHMVAADLDITTSSAGMLVTAFALSAAIGAPVVIAATIQVDRKKILLGMLGIFILSCFLAYFSPSFEMMLVARVIQGLSGGATTVIAMAVATRLVEVQHRGRAIGTILMGLSSSLVLGVPVGTFLSEAVGWRTLFILIGLLTLIPLLAVFARVPSIIEQKAITIKMQLSILKNKKIVLALAVTLFYIGGYSTLFTYMAPFLQANAELSAAVLSGILLLFGLCSFAGSKLGGVIADTRGPKFAIYAGLSLQAGMLLLLTWANGLIYALIPLIMIWMVATWMTSPAQQLYLVSLVPRSPDIPLSVNTSFIQFGFAFGSAIGGQVINSFSIDNLGWAGFVMVLLALLIAVRLFAYNNKSGHETVYGDYEKPNVCTD